MEDLKTQWKTSNGMLNSNSQKGNLAEQSRKLKNSPAHKPSISALASREMHDRWGNTGKRPSGAKLPPATVETTSSESIPDTVERRKTRLNMLNPMSLLARRRNSHSLPQIVPPQTLNSKTTSMLYDPSIRGTKIHDFSAPRTRKNAAPNNLADGPLNDSKRTNDAEDRPWSGGNHTPVFKEDFEEEQYPAAGPHVRKASDLTDLHIPNPPYARQPTRPAPSKSDNPDKLNLSPILEKRNSSSRRVTAANTGSTEKLQLALDPKAKLAGTTENCRIPVNDASQKRRSRGLSNVSTGDPTALHGLPKHMKSTSSRFSFDMVGAAKQEKLLEDRHRQRAAERKAASPTGEDIDNGEFDDFDYDGMIDDDGLEERIPGVNADLDAYEAEDDAGQPVENAAGFTFQSSSAATLTGESASPCIPQMLPTPRDSSGETFGFAYSKGSPEVNRAMESPFSLLPELPTSLNNGRASLVQDTNIKSLALGLAGIGHGRLEENVVISPLSTENAEPSKVPITFPAPSVVNDDDDLYFDDGIIDNVTLEDAKATEFDESVFDAIDTDRYGRPVRPFTQSFGPPPPFLNPEDSREPTPTRDLLTLPPNGKVSQEQHTEGEMSRTAKYALEVDSTPAATLQPPLSPAAENVLAPHPSISELRATDAKKSDATKVHLTQESLAAYQSALAEAAFTAAASGRFRRPSSPTTVPDEQEEAADRPGLIPDSGRQSEELFSLSYDANHDDFDYDDEMDDDEIIAAANAEALAYDCEGFYGQEFGFYSAPPSVPPANGSSEFVQGMGGYFGPSGTEGVMRNMSGRNMCEPNLTPITERSEYSNRNSIMSLQLAGYDVRQSLASPGLSQLAGMMSPYEEENMSFGALMKLRRGAWGGSQASLHSAASDGSPKSITTADDRQNSSPIPSWQSNGGQTGYGHARQNSNFSLTSDAESRPAAPVRTGSSLSISDTPADAETSASSSPFLTMASSSAVESPTFTTHEFNGRGRRFSIPS